MSKTFSKLFFRLSITSLVGISCLALAPSALANGNKDKPKQNQTPSTTTTNTSSTSCSLTDVLIGTTNTTKATACKGPFTGNDTGAQSTLLDDLNKGLFNIGANATWELIGKSDSSDNFGFEAQNGKSSGTWSLGKALGNGPTTFVVSLKSSTSYSTYLFKDIDFSKTGLTGLFNTIGVALNGNGSQGKDLSHASIFKATYAKTPEPPRARVPEPTASIGLGIVMGGMVINRRRKSK
ncbi:PEP-CTERM sorting domain-containing protein [Anabaena sp. FACHB-709]|uniref:PEP-CTERM protein-sorting domain-containing protein n=2 Tax=Nostocaceae TaxID=1162 RepID=A0A1Z4KKJ6_ANAVA|nr:MULTISPECIES: PEP-CTERM sorting domain-containing protein [Nostocaceae]BAY69488.1 hypothetical protein NIES23_22820 [Trichormus variabilis NIES-23]HBW30085.1 PEP-CTERM sorting domain-containing protein [Nostoc sp. UBA8866]MBD2171046.1 PEP-CTERM sorting domain-containing protein [Anabaena cylindrica FACHB-318]MBD2262826.1 PEP-CTERM sorting domain-containing protein [Anabaena sp. FACHB-709]MBD2272376.1 PEP-CTERM sorting domain-containing protein [Nostoc sp. PCC 7120 = FACHB-418]